MSLASLLDGDGALVGATRTKADGPAGRLPLTPAMLLNEPSGNLFGMTQDAGMGWDPDDLARPHVLVLSTLGGLRWSDQNTWVSLPTHTDDTMPGYAFASRTAASSSRRFCARNSGKRSTAPALSGRLSSGASQAPSMTCRSSRSS